MTSTIYSGLVAKVLSYGDIRKSPFRFHDHYDYLADGFDQSHVPDLIRILYDDELADADADSSEVWAQSHAWRILGQLRAEDAIVPLLSLLRYIDKRSDDWVQGEVPGVLAQIGPAALKPAADYLVNPENGDWARVGAISTIEKVGKQYPETQARAVEILSRQLEHFTSQSDSVNASLIDCLTEFVAVESAPLMARAFAAGRVDLAVRGDWEDIQVELELLDERVTPKRNYGLEALFGGRWFGDADDEDDEDDEEYLDEETVEIVQRAVVDPEKKKRKRKRKEAQKQQRIQRKRKKK